MDFRPDPALDDFRQTVRVFLGEKLPADLVQQTIAIFSSRDAMRRWQAILNDQGWGAPSWGTAHGGTGWSVEEQLIFEEECTRAGAPTLDGFGHKLLGPVLNHFATPEQWEAHVPHILRGERNWCQGFSEPGSGSDLASLMTRAERRGDSYVINGQKIWTSNAHRADWIFLLARTDPEAKKQAGISFFLIDMATPGITVRPIWSIDGRHHLNEVFFDEVEVPAGNLVGEEGMGWAITKFLLNNEHATTAELPVLKAYLGAMKRLAVTRSVGDAPLVERSDFLTQIARFEAELGAVAVMVQRVAALHGDTGHLAHALGSMLKLRATDLQQRMSLFLVEMLGDEGALASPAEEQGLASEMFFRRASTIYGGSSEVQRGIVAKLMFGL
ncbi:acyl-CoA dehydrogenase family protein [Sphingopyxis sp.]|uniref:acyl-CoA dehydrogenase family protein n=1 Tax=Sphingopyxis sp. TaxID=1908224 RepID=UPI0025DAFC37|nr:acyl-CoA dehydrogenase family protein [Sphingopyxis sp.]MBR2172502.1 acyl-CoA dehydrogenase family protein [Sphingopyxis sp.]